MKKYIPAIIVSVACGIFLSVYFGLLWPGGYLLVFVPAVFSAYLVGFIGLFKLVTKQSTVRELAIIGITPFIMLALISKIFIFIAVTQDKLMMDKSEKQDQLVRDKIPYGIKFKEPSYLFATLLKKSSLRDSVLVANIPVDVTTDFDYPRLINNLSFKLDNQPGVFFVLPDCQIGNIFSQLGGFHKKEGVEVQPGSYELTVKFLFYGEGCNNGLLDYLRERKMIINRVKDRQTRVSLKEYPVGRITIVDNPSEEFMY